ncbi:MAG: LCCL domain-containing protein [Verrucomicrobia bacterium]|nr:LCCL domain-containing protein [Verrucomicrobiota bacterium]
MYLASLHFLLRRPLALLALLLAAATATHAVTNDELLPANLVGKTLTCTYSAGTPNTLEATNNFTIQFTSASTYVRTSPLIQTEGGTYSVLDSSIAAATGNRATTIQINNNWLSQGSSTAILLVLTQQNGFGAYAASEFFNPLKNTGGLFTLSGSTSGGGGTVTTAPVVTSATTATATVGTPFTYQITATPAATSYTNAGGNAPIQINPSTGLVTGTFTAAGTYTFSYTAVNSVGGTKPTVVTVTVTGGTTGGGTVASYAGTYTGSIFVANNGAAETTLSTFSGTVSTTGALVAQGGEVTGTVNAAGVVTFAANGLGLSTGTIVNRQLSALGAPTTLGTTTRVFRISATGGTTASLATAPANFVGYRNKVGSVYQFTVTGNASGAVWGTDVYTDDSAVATAAVHAGVLAVGETKTVTVTILPGQSSYAASTRNNIKASSWGAWSGSYSFAGAGVVAGTSVAAARPTIAPGYSFGATSYAAGGRLVLPISVVGGGTYSYQWYFNGGLISGATTNPYIVDTLTTANAGTYTVDVTNSLGTSRLTAGTITVGASGSPTLALQPISKTVVPGATFTLAASATGTGLTYQWLRNNTALPGETGAILLRNNASANDSGSYAVRVTNSSGTVTSNAATITLSANASRPANISVRTNVASGALVTPGFVIQGSGSKRVLIRAVGPGLAAFGLGGTMADPKFTVFQGSTKVAENDNWTAANVGEAFAATGAFAIAAGSKDAALVTDLAAGKDYTVQVTNASGAGGIVLIEVYDADALKGTSTSKLVNVSVRGQTAPGDDVLTLGLVIGGTGPRTLLVRGVGPKLASFGVTGTVADPRLQIIDSQGRAILGNDDWGSADFVSELALATNYVGAFALDAGSKDAATLSLVEPGAYTIQVSGTAASPTGEALVEVYEVP